MNSEKPNIVLIMADQLACNVIGGLGHPVVKTPNIDKLIKEGTTFENCYCNSPICAPSRAVLVTGKLVSNNKVYDNGAELPASIPTFMHHLRGAGYETLMAGKMHFIGPDQLHGFEKRLTTDIYPAGMCWTPDWRKGTYPNPGTSVRRLKDAGICDWNIQMSYDEEVLYRTLEKIRQWGEIEQDRPFFMCASFTHPHCPFMITEKYWNMYEDIDIPMPYIKEEESDKQHPYNQWIHTHHETDKIKLTDQEIKNARRAYYGMVSYLDELVGKITGELERMGLADNTVIMLTSDHGDMLGEHGMWFKRTFYDPSVKVPLIIKWPKEFEKGRKLQEVVSLVDLCPTIMDIAGTTDSEKWKSSLDGDSLLKLLKGDNAVWKDKAICEYFCEGVLHSMMALRSGRYKYVYVHENEDLLFDIELDPHETRNLASLAEYQEVRITLKDELLKSIDVDAIEKQVLKSQQERLMMGAALKAGEITPWDYQPFFDASKQYVRNKKKKVEEIK